MLSSAAATSWLLHREGKHGSRGWWRGESVGITGGVSLLMVELYNVSLHSAKINNMACLLCVGNCLPSVMY